jgi:hypothetical protein
MAHTPMLITRPRRGRRSWFSHMALALFLLMPAAGCHRSVELTPIARTFESPEALAREVLGAIERNDVDALRRLPLTEQEFRQHVWPQLPASRTQGNVPFDFVWDQLHQRSDLYLRQTVARYGGHRLDLIGVDFQGDTTEYDGFVVRRETSLRVRDDQGRESSVRLFGSVMEQGDRYKLFSFVSN